MTRPLLLVLFLTPVHCFDHACRTDSGLGQSLAAWLRATLLGVFAVASLLNLPAPVDAQDLPTGFEEGLFEIRVHGFSPETRLVALAPDGAILVPLDEVLALTGVVTAEQNGMLGVVKATGRDTVWLDPALPAMIEGDTTAVDPAALVRSNGTLLLSTDLVERLLDATVEVDWSLLRITLSRDPPFPTQLAAEREARRAHALLLDPASDPVAEDFPIRPRTGGGVVSWTFSSPELNPFSRPSLHSEIGLAVLGGEAALGVQAQRGGSDDAGAFTSGRYYRPFPDNSWLTQLFLGDVTTRGALSRSVRGVVLTNRPRRLDPLFDQVIVDPGLPPGWQYEVYRDGRLLGYSDPSSPQPVLVPLAYGRTPLQVRMYGPSGELIQRDLLYQVPPDHLPPGRIEYSAGGGACPDVACTASAYMDTRYGLIRSVTIGAGMEYLRGDSVTDRWRGSGVLSLAPEGPFTAEIQVLQKAFTRAALRYNGPVGWSGRVSGRLMTPGAGAVSPGPASGDRWQLNSDLGTPWGRLSLFGSGQVPGPTDHWRLAASRSFHGAFLQGSIQGGSFLEGRLLGLRAAYALPRRLIENASVSAGLQLGTRETSMVEVGGALNLPDEISLNGNLRWQPNSGPTVSLGMSYQLGDAARFRGYFSASHEQSRASYVARGGLAYGKGTGVHPVPEYAVSMAGARGRVFEDHDGDGQFGPGDVPATDLLIQIGALRARTDSAGRYELWGLQPYDVVAASVDTVRSFLPTWQPTHYRVGLRPVPHVYNVVDFPLTRVREVMGRLEAGERVATAAGIGVQLVSEETGEVHEVLTFSDGSYYFTRVSAGRYRLNIRPAALQALEAQAIPEGLQVFIPHQGEDPFVELEPIRLVSVKP